MKLREITPDDKLDDDLRTPVLGSLFQNSYPNNKNGLKWVFIPFSGIFFCIRNVPGVRIRHCHMSPLIDNVICIAREKILPHDKITTDYGLIHD
jgi:hypothetical protein